MTAQTNAPWRMHHAPISSGDLIWRIANSIMTASIGFILAGSVGALAGLAGGIALGFIPALFRFAPRALGALARQAAPHISRLLEQLASYLPAALWRALQGRRA